MEKRTGPVNFRPTKSNRERLNETQELGIDMPEYLNGLIEKYHDKFLKDYAQSKIQQMQKVLSSH